jgi:hypothetical protein
MKEYVLVGDDVESNKVNGKPRYQMIHNNVNCELPHGSVGRHHFGIYCNIR